ncbi:hypothetical protein ABK040_012514 [Willaertia magna]
MQQTLNTKTLPSTTTSSSSSCLELSTTTTTTTTTVVQQPTKPTNEITTTLDQSLIINNFKLKYPEYSNDFIKIIQIHTSLNTKKEKEFCSCDFKAFDFTWFLSLFPKGDEYSKKNECAIYLSVKCASKKGNKKMKVEHLISNIHLDESSIDIQENEFDNENVGYGGSNFKQKDYCPIVLKDKQIFHILVVIKKLD